MKYRIFTTIILLASISMAATVGIPKVSQSPVIDGTLSAGEWAVSYAYTMVYPITTAQGFVDGVIPNAADLSANVYACWDEDYLYMAFRVYDDSLNWLTAVGAAHNGQDAVQLAFNLLNASNAVYRTNSFIYDFAAQTSGSGGADIYDDRSNIGGDLLPNAAIASTVLADGYIIEVALKWSDFNRMNYSPTIGDRHGAGVMLVDFDSGVYHSLLSDFGASMNDVTNAAAYNTWVLVTADGCGLNGIMAGDFDMDCLIGVSDLTIMAQQWLVCSDPDVTGCVQF